jgi:anti-sigma-K factor RskA
MTTWSSEGGGVMGGGAHDRYEDGVGAYLLGALSDLERRAFERHVMGCATCRDELELLRPAVDALPRSVTPLEPPSSLKASIMRSVADDAATSEAAPAEPRAGLVGRARRRTTPLLGRFRPAGAWATAVLLLGAGVLGGLAAGELLDGDGGQARIAAEVDESRLVQGSGTLLVPGGEDPATLSVHGLPPLPAEDSNGVYQTWVVRGSEVIPSSVFSVNSEGAGAATLPEGVENADAVLVTREPAGGSRAPSEDPVMTVELD